MSLNSSIYWNYKKIFNLIDGSKLQETIFNHDFHTNSYKKNIEEIYFNLGAEEVYTVALISRPTSSHLVDYYGFQINDEWIFGYGLDWKGKRRTIEDIKYFEHNID